MSSFFFLLAALGLPSVVLERVRFLQQIHHSNSLLLANKSHFCCFCLDPGLVGIDGKRARDDFEDLTTESVFVPCANGVHSLGDRSFSDCDPLRNERMFVCLLFTEEEDCDRSGELNGSSLSWSMRSAACGEELGLGVVKLGASVFSFNRRRPSCLGDVRICSLDRDMFLVAMVRTQFCTLSVCDMVKSLFISCLILIYPPNWRQRLFLFSCH